MRLRFTSVLTIGILIAAALPLASASANSSGRYIVVLKDSVSHPGAVASDHARDHGAQVDLVYRYALKGYAARMSAQAAARVSADRRVAYVEADQLAHTFAQEVPTGIQRTFADDNSNITINSTDDERINVDVAIIDTGIDFDHPDLNVVARTDCSGGGPFSSSCTNDSGDDGNGHGTHVAGTVAAIDNGTGVVGMAPGARLWAVKVLGKNGSGYISWIVAGIDYVTANASSIEVANMSLGCECSSAAMDDAIETSVDAGVVYAVAAGNSTADASTHSPANHPDVITVSALADFDGEPGSLVLDTSPYCRDDEDDTLANFSNWGDSIEIAAPGVCILSTWMGGGYNTISGTSMASPHVAGAAALLATGENNPDNETEVFAIRDTLESKGNINWTDDSGDCCKEPLLDVGNTTVFDPVTTTGSGDGGGSEDTSAPTNVAITEPAEGAVLSGTVTVAATADDEVGVTKVEFFANATKIEEDTDSSGGWSISWNITPVAGGPYTLTARAWDAAGNSTTSAGVGVTVDNPDTWTLSATGYKVKGGHTVDLSWSNAPAGGAVDIWRKDGAGSFQDVGDATTRADGTGFFTDNINKKGKGTYTYKVCEAGNSSSCSNEVTVNFN